MSDQREALAHAILVSAMCPGQERIAARVADALLAEFLIVPRKDIEGYEYGFRLKESKVGERTYSTQRSRQDAIEFAGDLRDEQSRKGQDVNATAVQRPILPWTPIPEGGEPE